MPKVAGAYFLQAIMLANNTYTVLLASSHKMSSFALHHEKTITFVFPISATPPPPTPTIPK